MKSSHNVYVCISAIQYFPKSSFANKFFNKVTPAKTVSQIYFRNTPVLSCQYVEILTNAPASDHSFVNQISFS
jgi:hypothetical protein